MEWFETALFYSFAIILLGSAVCVVTAKNPVHSVLYLVLSFFTGGALWLLLQAEFLAMILMLVYVGAVMVLFLFVVMMVDFDIATIKPLDVACVTDCLEKIGKIITVEDHNIINGLGSAVCEVAAELGKGKVKRVGIQDRFGESAPYERLLARNGVTVEDIVKIAETL